MCVCVMMFYYLVLFNMFYAQWTDLTINLRVFYFLPLSLCLFVCLSASLYFLYWQLFTLNKEERFDLYHIFHLDWKNLWFPCRKFDVFFLEQFFAMFQKYFFLKLFRLKLNKLKWSIWNCRYPLTGHRSKGNQS